MLREHFMLKQRRLYLIKERHRRFILKTGEQGAETIGARTGEGETFDEEFDFAN